jgi:hypothetical protein
MAGLPGKDFSTMEFERPAPDFSVRIDADESEIVFEALQDLWLLSAEAPLPTQNPYRDAGTQHFHERVFRTIEQTRVIAVAKLQQRRVPKKHCWGLRLRFRATRSKQNTAFKGQSQYAAAQKISEVGTRRIKRKHPQTIAGQGMPVEQPAPKSAPYCSSQPLLFLALDGIALLTSSDL